MKSEKLRSGGRQRLSIEKGGHTPKGHAAVLTRRQAARKPRTARAAGERRKDGPERRDRVALNDALRAALFFVPLTLWPIVQRYICTYIEALTHCEAFNMAARIWTIQNQKGGTTKTTTATNVACCLADTHGKSVLLVDLDGRQGSATDWATSRDDEATLIPCVIMRETLKRDLPRISSGYDYVIIDGIPQISTLTSDAVKASDLVIIPVQPSQYDIWATADMVQLVKDRQEITGGAPKAVLMIARAIAGTILERDAQKALLNYELPLTKTQTHQRVAYGKGIAQGNSVMDLAPDDEARQEIEALTRELLELDK